PAARARDVARASAGKSARSARRSAEIGSKLRAVEMMEPIEAIVPRRAQGYGEFVRRVALLARAGLPLPPGYASARDAADAFYADCLDEQRRLPQLLDPAGPS